MLLDLTVRIFLVFFKLFFLKLISYSREEKLKKTSNSNLNLSYLFSFLLFFFSSFFLSLANCHWLFIASDRGQQGSALKKNCIGATNPPTISATGPPNMINLCIIDFVLLYIIINIYIGKLKSVLEKARLNR
jgi:ABC-type antimicrobial peptide transport system permease subunit